MKNLFFKKNPLQDLLFSLNAVISTNESNEFITGHLTYNPAYTYKFQLKTTTYVMNRKAEFHLRSCIGQSMRCGVSNFNPSHEHN